MFLEAASRKASGFQKVFGVAYECDYARFRVQIPQSLRRWSTKTPEGEVQQVGVTAGSDACALAETAAPGAAAEAGIAGAAAEAGLVAAAEAGLAAAA